VALACGEDGLFYGNAQDYSFESPPQLSGHDADDIVQRPRPPLDHLLGIIGSGIT
jgi:hypothetical protein